MATDYCFLKFIPVRKSFKKHFPHLSLGVPAHQTKPPICFSTAVNFAALVSTRLQGRKATTVQCPVFHSLSPSELSEAGVVCRASCVWSSPLYFFFFLALQMLPGPPEVGNGVSQTEGSGEGERCYRWAELSSPAPSYGWGVQGELLLLLSHGYLQGGGGGVAAPAAAVAVWEQGWPQDKGTKGAVPRGQHLAAPSWCCGPRLEPKPVGAAGRVRGALGVVSAPLVFNGKVMSLPLNTPAIPIFIPKPLLNAFTMKGKVFLLFPSLSPLSQHSQVVTWRRRRNREVAFPLADTDICFHPLCE